MISKKLKETLKVILNSNIAALLFSVVSDNTNEFGNFCVYFTWQVSSISLVD